MSNLPRLSALTPDDQVWRLDWFGEVAYPGMVRQYRQPCIKVAISPLLNSPSSFARSGSFSTDISQQRNVWVSLGALSMLRIGDLWQDGRLLQAPLYTPAYFELDINPGATSFVKAGLAIEENYLLPFAEHPWHRSHTQSYCLTVKTAGNETLIIPGAELVRFYFGSSSSLIKRLVEAPFQEEKLWLKKHFHFATGHLHLKLAPGLNYASLPDIGRIARDTYALRSASSIYNHILKATSQKEAAYLYSGFPFQGKTDISVAGMWLPFSGRPKSTFLVFSLRNCSHSFPFASLSCDPIDRLAKRGEIDTNGAKQGAKRSANSSNAKIEHGDPGSRKASRRYCFEHNVRFPDLRQKPIWREKLVATGATKVLMRRADGSLEKLAFGEAEGSGDTRAIDIAIGEPSAEVVNVPHQQLPRFVRTGMAMAISQHPRSSTQITAKPLLPFGRAEPAFMLPMVVDTEGVIDTSLMHIGLDGEQRLKRACFIALFENDKKVKKLVIIEGEEHQSSPIVFSVASTELMSLMQLLVCIWQSRR